MRVIALLLLALLPACAGPGAIRTSEIRPLLLGQVEGAGILPRHDRYAEGDAAALRQSQAVRAELEEETTSAEELEAAGITPVLERHDAGVRASGSPLSRIWLQSSETMRRVLRASRGD